VTKVDSLPSGVLAHSEKLGLAFDPSVAYWRGYYAASGRGAEPRATERLGVFREALSSVRASGLWLDAGCGIGAMARQFRESGLRLCGIDMSAALLEEARRVTGLPLVAAEDVPPGEESLSRASVELTPYADGQFDGVYSSSVLEYAADLEVALRELHRVVRKGGHLVFNLPNAFSAFRIANAIRRQHLQPGGKSWYFRLVPRWAYWKWEITRSLERTGWQPLRLSYYGAESMSPSLPDWVPAGARARLAVQPWAASFVLLIARK
jgi:SAM-dependent methyltransferase